MAILHVYVSKIPGEAEYSPILSKARDEYVRATKNEEARRERYYAWRLLEYAALRSFGIPPCEIKAYRRAEGGWGSDKLFFSISHSEGLAAVAVSDSECGVDIQAVRKVKGADAIGKRIFGKDAEVIATLPPDEAEEYFVKCWCKYEARYKTAWRLPISKCGKIEIHNGKYYLAVAGNEAAEIRFAENVLRSEK